MQQLDAYALLAELLLLGQVQAVLAGKRPGPRRRLGSSGRAPRRQVDRIVRRPLAVQGPAYTIRRVLAESDRLYSVV